MGIDDLMICEKHTHGEELFYYYHVEASAEPPTNVRDIQDCGCYILIDYNETDRCFMSHTTKVTNHYLCSGHMEEYRINKRESEQRYQDWLERTAPERELKRQEQEKNYREREKLVVDDKSKMFNMITTLAIPRLKEIRLICEEHGWRCDMHRGMICVWSRGGIGKFNYKRLDGKYVFHEKK